MFRQVFVAAAVTVSLLGVSAAAQAPARPHTAVRPATQAPAHTRPRPAAHLPKLRVVNLHLAYEAELKHVRPGKIAGIVYAKGKEPKRPGARPDTGTCAEPDCPLVYQPNDGPVQTAPAVYLVLWGPDWSSDPDQAASATYLEDFYEGLGARQTAPKDDWSTILSQYGDNTGGFPLFSTSVLGGMAEDSSIPPTGATQADIAAEADVWATYFGVSGSADAQIVVATQSGTCPEGFDDSSCPGGAGTNCGWHSYSSEPYINLPYVPDAGAVCGEDQVNPTTGTYDGFSLVGGAEYADTVTDPIPSTGAAPALSPNPAWIDADDEEVADKCSWQQSGTPRGDVTLSTGTFAMQSLWSNYADACVMSDTVTVTSPGGQSDPVNSSVSLQLQGSSSAGYPLTWSETGLPPGVTMTPSGLITGTLTTPGTYGVTITAADASGTSRGVSFNWDVTSVGSPLKGPNGKCLDDYGGSATNGNVVDIWTCNNTSAQEWTFTSTLSVVGKCLSDHKYTGAGTKLVLWTCVGHKNEQWKHRSNGEYVLATNGLCLTDPSNSAVNGTQVEIRDCKDFKDQRWSLPAAGAIK